MKENEENRSLNDKKAYKDQFTTFVSSGLELSLYSLILSYSCTLRSFLEHFWSTLAYLGFGARRQRKVGKHKGIVRFLCR